LVAQGLQLVCGIGVLTIALYRLLYATKRQNTYLWTLCLGTILIVGLNLLLIPRFGTGGAIGAVVLGTAAVDLAAMLSLRSDLPGSVFVAAIVRLGFVLGCTSLAFIGLRAIGLNEWCVAIGTCLVFPAFGFVNGLIPHPRRSLLFG
jgi:O-antigen/teichoic acid export membrane protein